MALLADRVKETTTTTGTGTITLAGAPAGFQSFNTAFANASLVYYVIQGGAEFEIGIGTVGTGTLARTQVLQSSNADALVPFSAGVKDVFCSYVADRAVTTVDEATLTNKTIDSITNLIGADHLHYKIKATATITKGQALKVTGYNVGESAIEVAPVSSASDVAVGIAYQALNTGDYGAAINTGLLTGTKTDYAGWALGDILYPDPATGGLTKTKPASGTYQACAYVMRVNANNGVLLCEFSEPAPVTATANTANTVVARDGSGDFSAGTITATAVNTTTLDLTNLEVTNIKAKDGTSAATIADSTGVVTFTSTVAGSITGNAGTATALQTARNINGVSFNGTADITVTAAAGTLTGTTLASNVVSSSLTSVGTLANLTVTNPITGSVTGSSGSTTGNAATATALQTARTINGVSFDGTADITVTAAAGTLTGSTLASGVTASSLTSVGTLSSLTVSGNLAVDTNTLFVNASTNRVGIGTTSPSATFHVNGPSGVTSFTGTTFLGALVSGASSTNDYTGIDFSDAGNVVKARIASYFSASGSYLQFGTSNNYSTGVTNTAMTIDFNGRVGVGTASPSHPFQVGTTDLILDASGNLGLGVTPSAWNSDYRVQQIGINTALYGRVASTSYSGFSTNAYRNSGGSWIYLSSAAAMQYEQESGAHKWYTAPSGTAGAAITFTERMRVDETTTAGNTALLLWDVDNGTLERVTVGAADSGGTGYKVLRIPN